ncbi:MAG: Gfo/Idh/MocA family oxidoreductase [Chloroflexi bacterium]|nr:Gfo/Idh/MocA family oxidoreductase [Chloroflexota bacterium]
MAKTYRVACIGASRMASWFDDIQRERAAKDGGRSLEWVPGAMASVCAAIDRLELVAVCDLKLELVERMQERWHVPAGYTDFREMIERERPDIVAIVTSYGSTHAKLAAEVAQTGLVRGIYCEKPIATSMAEADRIVAACRRHGVVYTCAHVFRWNARYRQALEWIRDGAIGEVRAITCSAMGTLLHSGTHQADALAGLAGDVDPEWAFGTVDVDPSLPQAEWPKMDPPGGGFIQMSNGVQLLMEARSPGPRVFHVSGTKGRISLWNDLRQVQLWRRGAAPAIVDLVPEPMLSPRQEKSYSVTQMEELLDVLDRGGKTSCDEIRAARALEMVLGLHLSHRAGGTKVRFPLDDRTFGVDTV